MVSLKVVAFFRERCQRVEKISLRSRCCAIAEIRPCIFCSFFFFFFFCVSMQRDVKAAANIIVISVRRSFLTLIEILDSLRTR